MSDSERTRRQLLAAATTGLVPVIAGCSTQSNETPTESSAPTTTDDTPEPTRSTPTATDTPETTATETETETDDEGPGYKQDHWHGRLFFEVNGELVDFDQPKYHLDNLEDDQPETVYFHFHDSAHGPNEWSNEKQIVTFQRALTLLPDISYEQQSGSHVVTYDGTTYDSSQSGTSIRIREGNSPIDPTTYQVAHDDDYYVQITTGDTKRNAEPAHDGAGLGTLLFDLNNIRLDFSQETYVGSDAASEVFHFHDDGNPYMWYKEGGTTLAEALNSLPGITYAKKSGSHVITYEGEGTRPIYDQTYDGRSSNHEITIKQRTESIDPTSYELEAGDIIWVYIQSDLAPENEH